MDKNKTQNLELLLGVADFSKFVEMKCFRYYELHKEVQGKFWTSDDEDVIRHG